MSWYRRTRKKSNLREYFLYFLILSSTVIVFAGGLYFYFSLRTLREAGVRNREESLILMRNTFENLISQIDNSVTLSSTYFQQYRNFYQQGRYTILLQLHEELNSISRINYVHGVCVYYRDWGYTVSESGLAGIEYYPDALFLKSLDLMGFRYQRTLFRSKPLRDDEFLPVLTIIRSIPVFYSSQFPEAWAVIDIDLASLNDTMENIFNVEDSFFSIMSADGMPLVSIGSNSMKRILDDGINGFQVKMSPSGVTRIEHSGFLILNAQSQEQEWSFVYIEPYSTIEQAWFGRFLLSAVGATALVLLVSVLGSLFFSRRVFIPIKAIFERTNTVRENTQKLKETDLILRKIDELIEYNSHLEQKKNNPEKNEIPYPVSIENGIYRAFRNGDIVKFEKAVDSFRAYYIEKQVETEKIQGAYLRLFCASEVFIPEGFRVSESPDYRLIFTFTTIDEIHAWIIEWFSQAFFMLHAHKRPQSRLLKDICNYIDANLGEDITAKGLWQRFNYHPSSLHKLFREEFHMTLKKYVDSKRIEKAKELLLTTNLKINEIAVMVGYSHTQSFIAFFHQAVNCTPLEFRGRNT